MVCDGDSGYRDCVAEDECGVTRAIEDKRSKIPSIGVLGAFFVRLAC